MLQGYNLQPAGIVVDGYSYYYYYTTAQLPCSAFLQLLLAKVIDGYSGQYGQHKTQEGTNDDVFGFLMVFAVF